MNARLLLPVILAGALCTPRAAIATGELHPLTGYITWAVVLCRFTDRPEPWPASAARANFLNNRAGGVAQFFMDQSMGKIGIDTGSQVVGWFVEPRTFDEEVSRTHSTSNQDRAMVATDCLDAARDQTSSHWSPPAGSNIVVVLANGPMSDLGFWGGLSGAVAKSDGESIGTDAQEMLHTVNIPHSFAQFASNDLWEYGDPYDAMSTDDGTYEFATTFGQGGPGYVGYNLDRLGWLPRSRILTFGADGVGSATLTLNAINDPLHRTGLAYVRVPFDVYDHYHYYTIEYRRRLGWDSAIPADQVLIHEIRLISSQPIYGQMHNQGANCCGGQYGPFLRRDYDVSPTGSRWDGPPTQDLNENLVSIQVLPHAPGSTTVQVRISTDLHRCSVGYVWREAVVSDHVCVTPDQRQHVREENAQANSRRGAPFGTNDTCANGFVWREATTTDHVCVTPDDRTVARGQASSPHWENPAAGLFGPNTCTNGNVWRGASESDYVCVSPDERDRVTAENAGPPHHLPGANVVQCVPGLVWRRAFYQDSVCVTPSRRSQIDGDNAAANSRLAQPQS